MFSQSHQGRGGIGGGLVLPQLQCDQWSVPSHRWQVGLEPRQNIGCFSPNPFYVWWLAWFQVPTPLPSQIFLRTSFCHFCQTAVWQRGQKTHRSIKFFLKVTQIIWDVWRPNSNKSQYHQFVWVLSSDLVQWLRHLFSNLISGSEKGGEGGPHSAHKCNMAPDQPTAHIGLQIVHFPQSVQTSAAPRGSKH